MLGEVQHQALQLPTRRVCQERKWGFPNRDETDWEGNKSGWSVDWLAWAEYHLHRAIISEYILYLSLPFLSSLPSSLPPHLFSLHFLSHSKKGLRKWCGGWCWQEPTLKRHTKKETRRQHHGTSAGTILISKGPFFMFGLLLITLSSLFVLVWLSNGLSLFLYAFSSPLSSFFVVNCCAVFCWLIRGRIGAWRKSCCTTCSLLWLMVGTITNGN